MLVRALCDFLTFQHTIKHGLNFRTLDVAMRVIHQNMWKANLEKNQIPMHIADTGCESQIQIPT